MFERYAKLGTQPYGTLRLKKEPAVGDILEVPEDGWKGTKGGNKKKIKVIVSMINDSCVFIHYYP